MTNNIEKMIHESTRDQFKLFFTFDALASEINALASSGNKTNLTRGRINSDEAVLTVTTRITPSSPGCSCVIRASGHLFGGESSERRMHSDPRRGGKASLVHFGLVARVCKYSRDHLCQKWSRIRWTSCHLESKFSFLSDKEGSGMASSGAPMSR